MSTRDLNRNEISLAKTVFVDTLPYDRIRVTDVLGFQNRPYTLCYPNVDDSALSTYKINAGPVGFAGMERSDEQCETLIHELTHVWQAVYSIWPASYIFSSAFAQVTKGPAAYKYEAGHPWEQYNAEQQAHIVEDWFAEGRLQDFRLYPYIRDKIRNPKRWN